MTFHVEARLERFTIILVCLMMVTSLSTVFVAPVMTSGAKTINDLIKGEQMLTNEKDAITGLEDQMVLMMYIREINHIMMKMTSVQLKTLAQERFLMAPTSTETKEQLMISIDKKMLDMNQAQLSSTLDGALNINSLLGRG